jgi:hypothetical protein
MGPNRVICGQALANVDNFAVSSTRHGERADSDRKGADSRECRDRRDPAAWFRDGTDCRRGAPAEGSGAEDGVQVRVGESAVRVQAIADATEVRRAGVRRVDVRGRPVVPSRPVRAPADVAEDR